MTGDPVRLEYRSLGLTCGFSGARCGSCCDLVLAGEPVEDRFTAELVADEVDRVWGTGFRLGRCELSEVRVAALYLNGVGRP
jgi:hypothetical protein